MVSQRARIDGDAIERGRLFAMFSFDVGYEIDLGGARAPSARRRRRTRNGGRKATPARVQYPSPAVALPIGAGASRSPTDRRTPR
jgi:hypothetical protein